MKFLDITNKIFTFLDHINKGVDYLLISCSVTMLHTGDKIPKYQQEVKETKIEVSSFKPILVSKDTTYFKDSVVYDIRDSVRIKDSCKVVEKPNYKFAQAETTIRSNYNHINVKYNFGKFKIDHQSSDSVFFIFPIKHAGRDTIEFLIGNKNPQNKILNPRIPYRIEHHIKLGQPLKTN